MPRASLLIRINQKGFSPVEVLLAATLMGVIATAAIGAIIYGRQSTANSGDRGRAQLLASEGLEAARNIRDASFANLTNGTFGIAQSANQWTFSGSSDATGIYTRQITISSVDAVRKTVAAQVSWTTQTGTQSVQATTRLTSWLAAIVAPSSWNNAILASSLDLVNNSDGTKVATQGNYAYFIKNNGSVNFAIIDISTTTSPVVTGTLNMSGAPTNIFVSGNYAYISNTGNALEMQIVDISNPASPSLVSTYNAPGNADSRGVYVVGNNAYLSRAANGGTNEFLVVNVSNPAAPVLTGSYGNNINMNEVYVSGNNAYVATESDTQEMLVINVAVPATPTLSTSVNLTGTTNAVSIVGYSSNRILISQGAIMYAYNVTTPSSPALLGSVTATGSGVINDIDVDAADGFAFIGDVNDTAEFQVINISNPASMSAATVVNAPGNTDINGVAYNSTLNVIVTAGTNATAEFQLFKPN